MCACLCRCGVLLSITAPLVATAATLTTSLNATQLTPSTSDAFLTRPLPLTQPASSTAEPPVATDVVRVDTPGQGGMHDAMAAAAVAVPSPLPPATGGAGTPAATARGAHAAAQDEDDIGMVIAPGDVAAGLEGGTMHVRGAGRSCDDARVDPWMYDDIVDDYAGVRAFR